MSHGTWRTTRKFPPRYDTTRLYNEKRILVLKQALVDTNKMLQAQEEITRQMGLALDAVPEENHLEDPGLAT